MIPGLARSKAKFHIGQVVEHRLFHYRGVIIDVDASFTLTEEWYRLMAKSRPPKDKPWYTVLVHNFDQGVYQLRKELKLN